MGLDDLVQQRQKQQQQQRALADINSGFMAALSMTFAAQAESLAANGKKAKAADVDACWGLSSHYGGRLAASLTEDGRGTPSLRAAAQRPMFKCFCRRCCAYIPRSRIVRKEQSTVADDEGGMKLKKPLCPGCVAQARVNKVVVEREAVEVGTRSNRRKRKRHRARREAKTKDSTRSVTSTPKPTKAGAGSVRVSGRISSTKGLRSATAASTTPIPCLSPTSAGAGSPLPMSVTTPAAKAPRRSDEEASDLAAKRKRQEEAPPGGRDSERVATEPKSAPQPARPKRPAAVPKPSKPKSAPTPKKGGPGGSGSVGSLQGLGIF